MFPVDVQIPSKIGHIEPKRSRERDKRAARRGLKGWLRDLVWDPRFDNYSTAMEKVDSRKRQIGMAEAAKKAGLRRLIRQWELGGIDSLS